MQQLLGKAATLLAIQRLLPSYLPIGQQKWLSWQPVSVPQSIVQHSGHKPQISPSSMASEGSSAGILWMHRCVAGSIYCPIK